MYINADPDAGTSPPGIGGPTGQRIQTRASIIALWEQTRASLEAAGAEVVEVDFPVVSTYEGDRPEAPTIATRGFVSPAYLRREIVDLSAWAWEDFLAANGDPALSTLTNVDGARIFPHPAGALPDRYTGFDDDIATYPDWVREHPGMTWRDMPELEDGLRGLERTGGRPGGVDGRPRPRRRRLPRRRRRRPRRHGREPRLRRPRLAQRRLGRERQPRHPPPRHPDGDGAAGLMDDIRMPVGSRSRDAPATTSHSCASAARSRHSPPNDRCRRAPPH
jgi:hypothetical protein